MNMYSGWQGEDHTPPPREGLKFFLSEVERRDYSIVVFTCRDPEVVWRWLVKYGFSEYILEVTNQKPKASIYLDDRGITFRGSFTDTLVEIDRFVPHWKAGAGVEEKTNV